MITLVERSTSAQRLPLFRAAMIAAPIAEELVFRGYLYSAAKRFLGGIPALLLTGSVFAVVHANISSQLCLEWSRTDRGALRKIPAKHLGGQASHKRLLVLPDYSPIKEKQTH